jgi:UDP-N-acetylmuramoyl-L-alanyl-D-glutamate--2,6-diaminopimelate ligase
MAEVAAQYSSLAIFTSDNPRSENPMDILADMIQGLKSEHKRRSRVIEDRRKAIQEAVENANPGDIILIAGKGHEKYQEIAGVRYHFDDKEELSKFFENR